MEDRERQSKSECTTERDRVKKTETGKKTARYKVNAKRQRQTEIQTDIK